MILNTTYSDSIPKPTGSPLISLAMQLLINNDSNSAGRDEAQSISHQYFIDIVKRYEGIIDRLCYSFASRISSFDDLRQDALINIWKGLDSFRHESNPQTWIYRIVLNTCVSTQRKEQRQAGFLPIDSVTERGEESVADNTELLELLISSLGNIDRSILLLWLEERPYEEISQIIGLSVSNVASRLHRIRKKLKENNEIKDAL